MSKEELFNNLKALDFERLSGSAAEKKACAIIQKEIAKAGGTTKVEDFPVKDFQVQKEKFYVTQPCFQEYAVKAYVGSLNTGPDFEYPFYYLENETPVSQKEIAGKIVLINGRLSYEKYKLLLEKEAKGFITYGGEVLGNDPFIDIRELRPNLAKLGLLPGVHMRARDAMDLVKNGAAAVKMETAITESEGCSQNIVSVIKGKIDAEIVFSAHYDSVLSSHGMYDNGSGSAILLELYRYYMQHKPYRTLRFIWCGSEERGLLGSKAYVLKHQDELGKIVLNVNVDVAGPVLGSDGILAVVSPEALRYLAQRAKAVNYNGAIKRKVYSSDSASFAIHDIPALNFIRFGFEGSTAYMHSSRDTLFFMSADSLFKTFLSITAFLDPFLNAPVFPIAVTLGKSMMREVENYLKIGKKFALKRKSSV